MEEMEDTLLALVMALKVRITCAHSLHSKHLAIHVARHLQKCTSPLNGRLFYNSFRRPPTYPLTHQTTRSATFFSSLARPLARIGNGGCCSDPSSPERSSSSSG